MSLYDQILEPVQIPEAVFKQLHPIKIDEVTYGVGAGHVTVKATYSSMFGCSLLCMSDNACGAAYFIVQQTPVAWMFRPRNIKTWQFTELDPAEWCFDPSESKDYVVVALIQGHKSSTPERQSIFREISQGLQAEKGMGGVSIWRQDKSENYFYEGSVGDFLSDSANQFGTWMIDGGWGGPPGPIVVRWNSDGFWENGGFGGFRFINAKK